MRGLPTLIRLHGFHLDEKRRKLAEIEKMRADLQARLSAIDDEVAREKEQANRDPAVAAGFGAFFKRALERKERLRQSIAELDVAADKANLEVADAYRELKKFELAKERRDQEAAYAENRAEQTRLDEIGINAYIRKDRR
ncbi:MAG: hypothetical protein FJX47_10600 [Alphaproteobacteria bacterium]|nr:hypothetical protein [Alphaproteobacteria bacterium]